MGITVTQTAYPAAACAASARPNERAIIMVRTRRQAEELERWRPTNGMSAADLTELVSRVAAIGPIVQLVLELLAGVPTRSSARDLCRAGVLNRSWHAAFVASDRVWTRLPP